jgi:hypothetical protein
VSRRDRECGKRCNGCTDWHWPDKTSLHDGEGPGAPANATPASETGQGLAQRRARGGSGLREGEKGEKGEKGQRRPHRRGKEHLKGGDVGRMMLGHAG